MAAIEAGQGRYHKAEPYALRASQVAAGKDKGLGPDHPYVAHLLVKLASLYLLLDRPDDARSAVAGGVAIASKSLGEDHPIQARALWLRGR